MKEEWKTIQGFEGITVSHYEVSNLGRLRSIMRNPEIKPRISSNNLDRDGYVRTPIRHFGKLFMKRRCRLVLETFVGQCPDGLQAMHLNAIRDDDRLENLKWGTPTENQRQRYQDGTDNCGEKSGNTFLTNEVAQGMIDEYYSSRITQKNLAKKYGMAQSAVSSMIRGATWKNLDRPPA